MSSAAEKKLEMSLDDIIKKDKVSKGGAKGSTKSKRGRGGGATRGGRTARGGGRRASAGERLAAKKQQARMKRALGLAARRGRTAGSGRGGAVAATRRARTGAMRRRNAALIAKLLQNRQRRQPQIAPRKQNARTLVQKLVKRALTTRSRLQSARNVRQPQNIQRVARLVKQLSAARSQRARGGGRLAGGRIGQRRGTGGLTSPMLNRLGWSGRSARRNNRVQLSNNARGRGFVAREAHMDEETRRRTQRIIAIRQQRAMRRRQQQQQQAAAMRQAQQLLTSMRGRGSARAGRFARGGMAGGRQQMDAFIRNTVNQAVAQASSRMMRRIKAQQMFASPMSSRQGGMLRMDEIEMQPRRQQMISMRSEPMYEERIQSRPIRANPDYTGGMRAWSSEFEPNSMQAAFASSSSGARTLDERFGGGRSNVRVGNTRQFYF